MSPSFDGKSIHGCQSSHRIQNRRNGNYDTETPNESGIEKFHKAEPRDTAAEQSMLVSSSAATTYILGLGEISNGLLSYIAHPQDG
jgi:hypothetical protein